MSNPAEPQKRSPREKSTPQMIVHQRILHLSAALDRGDFATARHALQQLEKHLNPREINEEDLYSLHRLRAQLSRDPVEYMLPVVLFIFWASLALLAL